MVFVPAQGHDVDVLPVSGVPLQQPQPVPNLLRRPAVQPALVPIQDECTGPVLTELRHDDTEALGPDGLGIAPEDLRQTLSAG